MLQLHYSIYVFCEQELAFKNKLNSVDAGIVFAHCYIVAVQREVEKILSSKDTSKTS